MLPESSVVNAFLTMSPDRVLNKQVRDFIRNGENASALEALNQIVTNSPRERASGSRTPSRRSFRTLDTRDSRESRRRRYRPRRDEIVAGGGTMLEIVAMVTHSIGSGIEGEMIAGDARGIVIGTVRGAGVTGGDVTIADRLGHEDSGR